VCVYVFAHACDELNPRINFIAKFLQSFNDKERKRGFTTLANTLDDRMKTL